MPLSNYPNGFVNGITLREFPIEELQNGLSNVFWVDSNKGSNGNTGAFKAPFATLAYAVSLCKANQGDKIYLAANHAETIVNDTVLDLNIAAIQVIGLGTGSDRPTFTFTTSTTASVVVSAASVYMKNLVFVGNIASQVTMVDCNSTSAIIDTCEFTEGSATGLTFIDIGGGGTNVSSDCQVLNCKFNAPTAGNFTAAIELSEAAYNIVIDNCAVFGDFDDACIHNPAGKTVQAMKISNCKLTNLQTGKHAIELVPQSTGALVNNYMYTDTYATTIDPGGMACYECYSVSSVDKNGRLNPVVET